MGDRRIYLGLDGVLADFDLGYDAIGGPRDERGDVDVDWDWLALNQPRFYADLSLMPDARQLVSAIQDLGEDPIILTGLPRSLPWATTDKRAWVHRRWPELQVICCKSKDKAQYCRLGDVLIDDRPQYRERWISAGGIWITHETAASSLAALRRVLEASCPT